MTPEQHLLASWEVEKREGDTENITSATAYVLPMLDNSIARDELQALVAFERPESEWGTFDTLPELRWDVSSKMMVLINDLTFTMPDGTAFAARAGLVTDGLSYPWWSLPILGGRFAGRARFAALIHDQLCADGRAGVSSIDSKEAHRIFYEAMRACGVQWFGAWIRWRGVSLAGTRFKRAGT